MNKKNDLTRLDVINEHTSKEMQKTRLYDLSMNSKILRCDLDEWAERLGEVIAQNIADKCYKDDEYEASVRRKYAALSDQDRFILWSYASVYSKDDETDLEEHIVQNMIITCQTMRYDEGI